MGLLCAAALVLGSLVKPVLKKVLVCGVLVLCRHSDAWTDLCSDMFSPRLSRASICYLPTALEKHMQTQKKSQASEFRKLC